MSLTTPIRRETAAEAASRLMTSVRESLVSVQDALSSEIAREREAVEQALTAVMAGAPPHMRLGLTMQQARCLAVIRARQAEIGHAPSVRELQSALGLSSRAGVHRLLRGLEERGHILRLPYRARSVVLIEPKSACPHCGGAL